jgi:hypothetical protein
MISERMASAGMLAAGVGHEINNPLAVVVSNVDFVTPCAGSSTSYANSRTSPRRWARGMAGSGSASCPTPLSDTGEGLQRIRDIVVDVKLFSRPLDDKSGTFDVRKVCDSSARMAWNWDEFLEGLDVWHHAPHLGVWFWRPNVWWKPQAGVSKAERVWLQSKYPAWEDIYGPIWDVIVANVEADKIEETLPATLPWLCNLCQLPVSTGERQVVREGLSARSQRLHVPLLLEGLPPDLVGGSRHDAHEDGDRALPRRRHPARGLARRARVDGYYARRRSGRRIWIPVGKGDQAMSAPQPVPINALFGMDFVSLLVVVLTTDTMAEVTEKVAANVVGKRIPRRDAEMAVYYRDERVPRERTVAQAGIAPMQFVYVDYVEDGGSEGIDE